MRMIIENYEKEILRKNNEETPLHTLTIKQNDANSPKK